MRLTCPNCGAQYEVPGEVIPETGRDVQCSNCGDTWFQPHRADMGRTAKETPAGTSGNPDQAEATPSPEPSSHVPSSPAPALAKEVAPRAEAKPAAAGTPPGTAPQSEADAGPPDDGDGPDSPDQGAPPGPRGDAERPMAERGERREIDPSVATVLREEAEREKRARSAPQGGLETQPELGLDDDEGAGRRGHAARQRSAPVRDPQDRRTGGDTGHTDPASRRDLFPDIEQINSSLGPEPGEHGGAAGHDAHPEAGSRARGGFRRGFLLALLIAVLALVVYGFAGPLAAVLPGLRDVLADYVGWVDGLRQWLDRQVAAAMLWLDAIVAAPPGDGG